MCGGGCVIYASRLVLGLGGVQVGCKGETSGKGNQWQSGEREVPLAYCLHCTCHYTGNTLATGTSHSMTTPKICPKVSPKGNQGLREWMRPERGGCTYTHKAHFSYCSTNHMAETAAEEVSLVLD